jgi:hypothetical protein
VKQALGLKLEAGGKAASSRAVPQASGLMPPASYRGRVLSRRTVLRGLGAAVALPLLDAMVPTRLFAGEPAAVRRLLFICVPNGVHLPHWTPAAEGPLGALPPILEPLAPHKSELTVLSGLTLDNARDKGDGPGDHARGCAAFLTGARARRTAGADLRCGVSVDQVAAAKLGEATPLASLELGCEPSPAAGNCDNAYSCAYTSNISWKTETMPMSKEVDPAAAFDRLFGAHSRGETAEERVRRLLSRKSVLDLVAEDAKRLGLSLGGTDRAKLDEYLSAVRDIEKRIDRSAKEGDAALPAGAARPSGIPTDFREHLRLMSDLIVLAFRADATRVISLLVANEQTNRSYPFLGVPESHHDVSHHGDDPEKHAKISRINRFHVEELAYLLGKLKAAQEGGGSLLDTAAVLYGSGISDGNRHDHENLPILLAGRLGGTLSPGRHVKHPFDTPLANLYVALLDKVGARAGKFADSTGPLSGV